MNTFKLTFALAITLILGLAVLDAQVPTERLVPENMVEVVARHADGTEFYRHLDHNIRTTAGINWQGDLMSDTVTPPVNAQCNYIALSNDSASPAAGDTAVASEITSNGLGRAQATYTHSAGATSYTLSHTWTATGTQASQKTGILTASSAGTLCFENTYTQATLNNTDTLTITWTINF
jgi:hypothetical protein